MNLPTGIFVKCELVDLVVSEVPQVMQKLFMFTVLSLLSCTETARWCFVIAFL